MERNDVNPWEWSKGFGFTQAIGLTGVERMLICSGQTATTGDGVPPDTSDMGEQMKAALDNLRTVIDAGDMTMADVVKLTVYTTDVDATLANWGILTDALGTNLPGNTLIGVARLAFPELKIEIEATAVR
jgi:enamine deaminase RidA (YjgF/YER057c/UK114 family)